MKKTQYSSKKTLKNPVKFDTIKYYMIKINTLNGGYIK